MRSIAIDIGTTKLCAVAVDEDSAELLEAVNLNNVFIAGGKPFERVQDPEKIFRAVSDMAVSLMQKHGPIRCIGISAQQHGILYTGADGKALSPLYTWQDSRAAEPYQNGKTYAEYLRALSTGRIAAGYGLATHFYNLKNGLVPGGAKKLCTIGDYLAARLSASTAPVIHKTHAAGLGFFPIGTDAPQGFFETGALEQAGIDSAILPLPAAEYEVIGQTPEGIPVCVALGDNQASFLGSVRDSAVSVLVNIGTGSQISLAVDSGGAAADKTLAKARQKRGLETRPFLNGKKLLVGASLCGGRAYAILENFFREVLRMAGKGVDRPLFPCMDAAAENGHDESGCGENNIEPLRISTLFAGTRQDPSQRGGIAGISEENFTPEAMIKGFLNGMAAELRDIFSGDPAFENRTRLVGSGNGVRRNRPLKRVLSEQFAMRLVIPLYQEEAAYGASLFALACTGRFSDAEEAQKMIRYEKA